MNKISYVEPISWWGLLGMNKLTNKMSDGKKCWGEKVRKKIFSRILGEDLIEKVHLGKELGASQMTRPCPLLGHMF